MRTITRHDDTIYRHKSSAVRVARKAAELHYSYRVEEPEIGSRFDGHIIVTGSMISVEPHNGGWRWAATFDLGDVTVGTYDEKGSPTTVRFEEVCHWPDCATPAEPMQGIGTLIDKYVSGVERVQVNRINESAEKRALQLECVDAVHLPAIRAACEVYGFTLGEVMKHYQACMEVVRQTESGKCAVDVDTRFADLDDFDGTCPECGAEMQFVSHGYDYEYDCEYGRYVCMEDGCGGDIHVEPESVKILE